MRWLRFAISRCSRDIFPTGYHGSGHGGRWTSGSIVYVAGGGPSGSLAAPLPFAGRSVVIVGDLIPERLEQAKSFGCETVDSAKGRRLDDQIEQIVGVPEVDCAVDAVGFEARGHGEEGSAVEERRPRCSTRSWK